MITDGNKCHYLAVSNLFSLLEEKLSNHHGYFYCLNCFNSYTTENKLKEHEEICNNHDSCFIQMPKWFEKILKYNPGEKSLRAPLINLSLPPSGWAMLTKCSFDKTEDKLDYYRGKDSIEKLCKKLKEHSIKIINYEEKK